MQPMCQSSSAVISAAVISRPPHRTMEFIHLPINSAYFARDCGVRECLYFRLWSRAADRGPGGTTRSLHALRLVFRAECNEEEPMARIIIADNPLNEITIAKELLSPSL